MTDAKRIEAAIRRTRTPEPEVELPLPPMVSVGGGVICGVPVSARTLPEGELDTWSLGLELGDALSLGGTDSLWTGALSLGLALSLGAALSLGGTDSLWTGALSLGLALSLGEALGAAESLGLAESLGAALSLATGADSLGDGQALPLGSAVSPFLVPWTAGAGWPPQLSPRPSGRRVLLVRAGPPTSGRRPRATPRRATSNLCARSTPDQVRRPAAR